MTAFPEAARALVDSASRGDRLGAWDATGRLLPWLSDLRNQLDAAPFQTLLWTGAINNRWFDIGELIAGAAASRADAPPGVRRLHAHMLIERGFYEEALIRLRALLPCPNLSAYDTREILGHIGRINKDRFIGARRAGDPAEARRFLREAIDAYDSCYLSHRSVWHGINAVALLSQPDALALDAGAAEKAQQIAREILENPSALDGDSYKRATLAEAHLALGDFPSVLDLTRSYVGDSSVSGFQIGNLRRQWTELWELDRRASPWPELIAMITAAALEREGAVLHLSGVEVRRARDVTSSSWQAVFGADRFDSYENYRRGLDRCACVARIGRSIETGVGTGFILPGNILCPKLGEAFVLLTNAHVISESDELREQGAVHPAEAVVTFSALDTVSPEQEFGLGGVLFSSPPEELDVAVVELKEPLLHKEPYHLAPVLPARGSSARVRVIGHPSGRGLSLSVNTLLDHEKPRMHYRTATEGGSSGSPVFNQDWKLIGIHHRGGEQMPKLNGQSGTYQANEGIWIGAICEAMAQ